MKKQIMKMAGLGFLLGIAVNSLISALTVGDLRVAPVLLERIGSLRGAMLLEFALVGLFGAICMAGTVLYDAERLPLAAATALHCLICIGQFIPLALFLGWCSSAVEVLIMAGFQLLTFFIVWLIMYTRYRKEIKQLNEMQKDFLDETDQDNVGGEQR